MRKSIWLIVCIFLLLLTGGIILFLFNDTSKSGLLKINGIDITQENVIIHPNYAELPLTEVMKSLNMKVEWVDESTAEITFKDKRFTLSLSNISLNEVGKKSNLLMPPPGGNRFYTVLKNELILDSNTIKSVMYQIGIRINIDIDRKEQIVYIHERID